MFAIGSFVLTSLNLSLNFQQIYNQSFAYYRYMILLEKKKKKNYRGVLKKVKKKEANKQTKIKNRETKKKKR